MIVRTFSLIALFAAHSVSATDITSRFFIEAAAGAGRMFSSAAGYNIGNFYNLNTYNVVEAGSSNTLQNPYLQDMSTQWGNFAPSVLSSVGFDFLPDPCGAFVIGFKIGGGYSGMKSRNNYTVDSTNDLVSVTGADGGTVYMAERGFLLAAFRLGGVIDKVWMPYVELGWSTRNIRLSTSRMGTFLSQPPQNQLVVANTVTTTTQQQRVSGWVNGLLVGIGLDWAIHTNWSVGALWETCITGRKTFSFSSTIFTLGDGTYDRPAMKISPLMSQFFVSLKYTLPSR